MESPTTPLAVCCLECGRTFDQGLPEGAAAAPPADPWSMTQALVHVLQDETNLHLTYETLILRLLQKVAHAYRVPWTTVLETTRHPHLDPMLQQRLQGWWHARTRPVTLDEQHCVERVLGRDHVRSTDLLKLAGCLHKVAPTPKDVWVWFGVDGLLGDDPKRYVDAARDRPRHVQAVRMLYEEEWGIETPNAMKEVLEAIFRGEQQGACRDAYVAAVGGWEAVRQVADALESKRKRVDGESSRKRSKGGKPSAAAGGGTCMVAAATEEEASAATAESAESSQEE